MDSAEDPLILFLDISKMCPAAMARDRFSSLESLSARARGDTEERIEEVIEEVMRMLSYSLPF